MKLTIADVARICYGPAIADKLIANGTAPAQCKPRLGDFDHQFSHHGVTVIIGWDLDPYFPDDDAVLFRSVQIDTRTITQEQPEELKYWLDVLRDACITIEEGDAGRARR